MGFSIFGSSGSKSTSSSYTDSRNQSVGADDGAISLGAGARATISGLNPEIARVNAEYQQAIFESSTDGLKALSSMGQNVLNNMGDSLTKVFELSGANQTRAFEHLLDKSGDLLMQQMANGRAGSDAANALAAQSISAANPQQDQNNTMVKIAIAVAVAFAVAVIAKGRG